MPMAMDKTQSSASAGASPTSKASRYEIRFSGRLPRSWTDWFGGFASSTVEGAASGETTLTGSVPDQSALIGLLNSVCRLNLTLLSVRRLD